MSLQIHPSIFWTCLSEGGVDPGQISTPLQGLLQIHLTIKYWCSTINSESHRSFLSFSLSIFTFPSAEQLKGNQTMNLRQKLPKYFYFLTRLILQAWDVTLKLENLVPPVPSTSWYTKHQRQPYPWACLLTRWSAPSMTLRSDSPTRMNLSCLHPSHSGGRGWHCDCGWAT